MAVVAAAGAALVGSIVGTGTVVGSGVAQAAPACPSMYVVAIPGTWETSDHPAGGADRGMLLPVTNGLPSSVRVDYVTYPATAFPWEGDVYGASKRQAVRNGRGMIAAMAKQCPGTRYGILGYSQGADAAGDLAAEIGTGNGVVPANKVSAVGLISDPRRSPTDAQVGPLVGGAGATGPRPGGFGWVSQNVRTICAPGDLYCAAPQNDFVSRIAGYVVQNSDPGSSDKKGYAPEAAPILGDLTKEGGLATLQGQLSEPDNITRGKMFKNFLQSGVHQDYRNYAINGSGESATTWMHDWFASKA